MIINENNLGTLLMTWFSKSIWDSENINYQDKTVFKRSLEMFKSDYLRYFHKEQEIITENLISWPPLIAVLLYRIAREYYLNQDERIALLYSNLGKFISGIEIYYTAKIGKSFKINHGSGTVIGAHTEIGDNCLIHQNVTFGIKEKNESPKIKNNVTVYAGAKILGDITIGNNCIIAANCVCFINVPDNKTAVGVPAKII